MAVPKRRRSKAKIRTRRAHWRKINKLPLVECPQCHELKVPHRMCAECGFYKENEAAGAETE